MTGWSDTVVNAIQCEAEARIYIGAGLKETTVNGKPALIQPRIDPNYQMPEWWIKEHGEKWRGWTNSDLMGEGYPWSQHREGENYAVLHTTEDYSDIDRRAFEKEKAAHWMARHRTKA